MQAVGVRSAGVNRVVSSSNPKDTVREQLLGKWTLKDYTLMVNGVPTYPMGKWDGSIEYSSKGTMHVVMDRIDKNPDRTQVIAPKDAMTKSDLPYVEHIEYSGPFEIKSVKTSSTGVVKHKVENTESPCFVGEQLRNFSVKRVLTEKQLILTAKKSPDPADTSYFQLTWVMPNQAI